MVQEMYLICTGILINTGFRKNGDSNPMVPYISGTTAHYSPSIPDTSSHITSPPKSKSTLDIPTSHQSSSLPTPNTKRSQPSTDPHTPSPHSFPSKKKNTLHIPPQHPIPSVIAIPKTSKIIRYVSEPPKRTMRH